MELLTQNSKLKKTSKELQVKVMNFGIPAYKSRRSGKVVCPFAKDCVKYCYARKGAYIWSNVNKAFEDRYEATKQDDFVDKMTTDIKRRKVQYVRVHDSGDYYSKEYRDKWFAIAKQNPDVRFYSYTKSVPLFQGVELPENYDIIYSLGSKVDHLINQDADRHSKIFSSHDELNANGYADASEMDLMATKWFNPNPKVGLVIH